VAKFFEDEDENEDEKSGCEQSHQWRMHQLREQQAGGVGEDDADKGTVHFTSV
jgi:hypothetical protein